MRNDTSLPFARLVFVFQIVCYLGAVGLLLAVFTDLSRITVSPAQFLIGILAAIAASVGMVALGLIVACLEKQR